ncbi:MAG TPA: sugar transferase [Bacteroidales bacterium]|nr:sugar transferase [Bacteroidales bacterium]
MKNNYIEYVHNLNGSSFENLKPKTREAIISYFKNGFTSFNDLQKTIINESSVEVLTYISEHIDLKKYYQSVIFSSATHSYVEDVDFDNVHAIINFKKINSLRYINEHFKSVNKLLPQAGIYIGRAETYWERKVRIYRKIGRQIGRVIWTIDFVFNRILPKLKYIENIYYYLTKGIYHTMSHSEVLGRLIYTGFDIIDYKVINGLFYFTAIKTNDPIDIDSPSYRPIIKLLRIGKRGKIIGVYKFRTMHPYAEFLQDYVLRINGYDDAGKPANDFRVTRWGRFFRRHWLDEFPQLINVIKGEMKLVGLRPLSRVRFNQFPEDLKKERIKYKPGCIAPYVALKMPDDKENIKAERIYIKDLSEHHYLTDFRYFMKAVYNILTFKIISS